MALQDDLISLLKVKSASLIWHQLTLYQTTKPSSNDSIILDMSGPPLRELLFCMAKAE